ncbi:hypothetical protein BS78_05G117900 [Paspalum vaginatum]|nr:hypothetical protein BS78_05G117900 [Paspalum vaginatum]
MQTNIKPASSSPRFGVQLAFPGYTPSTVNTTFLFIRDISRLNETSRLRLVWTISIEEYRRSIGISKYRIRIEMVLFILGSVETIFNTTFLIQPRPSLRQIISPWGMRP